MLLGPRSTEPIFTNRVRHRQIRDTCKNSARSTTPPPPTSCNKLSSGLDACFAVDVAGDLRWPDARNSSAKGDPTRLRKPAAVKSKLVGMDGANAKNSATRSKNLSGQIPTFGCEFAHPTPKSKPEIESLRGRKLVALGTPKPAGRDPRRRFSFPTWQKRAKNPAPEIRWEMKRVRRCRRRRPRSLVQIRSTDRKKRKGKIEEIRNRRRSPA